MIKTGIAMDETHFTLSQLQLRLIQFQSFLERDSLFVKLVETYAVSIAPTLVLGSKQLLAIKFQYIKIGRFRNSPRSSLFSKLTTRSLKSYNREMWNSRPRGDIRTLLIIAGTA
ncbi:hypothetical protein CEXT_346091 [Caerostris extrusa]|uniref:Uncharacterized protein n=1 Tax=Caerostris extrusa TaxID=172846 RepID=A0AAV4SYV1_CAEEX|nr:hypothetical protein CEXT_346091 [Caerostris extrusa]